MTKLAVLNKKKKRLKAARERAWIEVLREGHKFTCLKKDLQTSLFKIIALVSKAQEMDNKCQIENL